MDAVTKSVLPARDQPSEEAAKPRQQVQVDGETEECGGRQHGPTRDEDVGIDESGARPCRHQQAHRTEKPESVPDCGNLRPAFRDDDVSHDVLHHHQWCGDCDEDGRCSELATLEQEPHTAHQWGTDRQCCGCRVGPFSTDLIYPVGSLQ
jgi:hypothetical protein